MCLFGLSLSSRSTDTILPLLTLPQAMPIIWVSRRAILLEKAPGFNSKNVQINHSCFLISFLFSFVSTQETEKRHPTKEKSAKKKCTKFFPSLCTVYWHSDYAQTRCWNLTDLSSMKERLICINTQERETEKRHPTNEKSFAKKKCTKFFPSLCVLYI